MADDDESEAIGTLLASEGWALFTQFVESEWGADAYARKIDSAIAEGKQKDHSVEADICELGAAARAVRVAAQWPVKRLAHLKTQGTKPAAARMFLRRGQ